MNSIAHAINFNVEFSLDRLTSALFNSLDGFYCKDSLHCCRELLYVHHLGGHVPPEVLLKEIRGAIGYAIEYFAVGRTNIDGWFDQLSDGIFLCSYCGLSNELQEVCDWATPRKTIQYHGVLDDEVQELHLALAALFQSECSTGFRRLLSKNIDSRKTRIRNLAAIIAAIRDRDQEKFATATRTAIQNYRKRRSPDPELELLAEWFPVHINTAYYAGLAFGLEPCCFPENVAAYLCGPFPEIQNDRIVV